MIFLAVLIVGLPAAFVLQRATDTGWRAVTSLEVLEQRGVIYVEPAGAFLVFGDPPLALSAESPHVENDPVAYCRSAGTFQEIHGGRFDRRGFYVDGPPPRGLDRIGIRVREDIVEINVSIVTEGAPRGAGEPLDVTGRLCGFDEPSDGADGFLEPIEVPA